jgi:hypothetical protein
MNDLKLPQEAYENLMDLIFQTRDYLGDVSRDSGQQRSYTVSKAYECLSDMESVLSGLEVYGDES